MRNGATATDDGPVFVEPRVCMWRLVHELQLLADMSRDVQDAIHTLDLASSSTRTRMALQRADTLTQTLECVKTALAALSRPREASGELDLRSLLEGISLEDVRERLLTGTSGRDRAAPGRVDLF